jgi:hypothetical protein
LERPIPGSTRIGEQPDADRCEDHRVPAHPHCAATTARS